MCVVSISFDPERRTPKLSKVGARNNRHIPDATRGGRAPPDVTCARLKVEEGPPGEGKPPLSNDNF